MKRLTNIPCLIYQSFLVGIFGYLLFVPLPIKAGEMSQTDTTVTSQFDITLLYWAIGIVGGCIAITLIYVSYKKYRGEKKRNNEDIYRHHDQE